MQVLIKRFSSFVTLQALAFVVLLLALVVQQTYIQKLTYRVRSGRHQVVVKYGTQIDKIAGLNFQQNVTTYKFPSDEPQPLMLITMMPECPACKRNIVKLKQIATAFSENHDGKVLWVFRSTISEAIQFSNQYAIPKEDVLADVTYPTHSSLNLNLVPQIIVLQPPNGTVSYSAEAEEAILRIALGDVPH